eukprot:5365288-Amphidinium_carterae.1
MGSYPPPECDPTPTQVSVLFDKIITRGEEPYADFSILTPFGKRVQRALHLRAWLFQEDGSYKAVEIPGPISLES